MLLQNNGKLLLVVNDVVKVELPPVDCWWWAFEVEDVDDDAAEDDDDDVFEADADIAEEVEEEDFIDDVNNLPLLVVDFVWDNFKLKLFLFVSVEDFLSFLSLEFRAL